MNKPPGQYYTLSDPPQTGQFKGKRAPAGAAKRLTCGFTLLPRTNPLNSFYSVPHLCSSARAAGSGARPTTLRAVRAPQSVSSGLGASPAPSEKGLASGEVRMCCRYVARGMQTALQQAICACCLQVLGCSMRCPWGMLASFLFVL
jgi:hypothetical protein